MKIKNVKPGDILKLKPKQIKAEKGDKNIYFDDRWEVVKVYRNFVLTHSVKVPEIRRCFCYGDLIILGVEKQGLVLDD